jgi:hypothetical protein
VFGETNYLLGPNCVEKWVGSRWRFVPLPAGADCFVFAGSALSSRHVWVETTAPNHQVLEWNGTHWHATGRLWGLTRDCCPVAAIAALSDRNVWAVGTCCDVSHLFYGVYITHWDGSRWQRVPAPFQDESSEAKLNDISAISADNLWAVGQLGNSALAEHYTCSR